MFTGRIGKHIQDIQYYISGSFKGQGVWDPPNGFARWQTSLINYRINNSLEIIADTYVQVGSNQAINQATAQFIINSGRLLNYTWTDNNYRGSLNAQMNFRNVRIYVDNTPNFLLVVGSVDCYVNGQLVLTAPGFNYNQSLNVYLQPAALPLLGIPPELSGVAANAGGAGDSGLVAGYGFVADGGWRIIDSNGQAQVFPVNCAPTAVPAGQYGSTGGTVSATNTWNGHAEAYSITYVPNSYKGQGGTYSQNARLFLIPSVPQGINKMGAEYQALIQRFDLGGFANYRYSQWSIIVGGGDPDQSGTLASIVSYPAPKTDGILSNVGTATHAIETPFSIANNLSCPYNLSGSFGSGSAKRGGYTETCGSVFPSPLYSVGQTHSNWLEYNGNFLGGGLDYWTHTIRMVNTWYSLGWSYFLWFPPEAAADSFTWKVDNGALTPQAYWLWIRQQQMYNPYLPVGENTKQRSEIITEPLFTNGNAGFLSSLVGNITSWVGVSRFQPLSLNTGSTIVMSQQPQWSVKQNADLSYPLNLSFGPNGVTVTPNGANTGGTVRLGLWGQDGVGVFNAVSDRMTLKDFAIADGGPATIQMYWEAYGGFRNPFTLIGNGAGVYYKPKNNNSKYMGSWVEDWGYNQAFDYGVDFLGSGESVQAYNDSLLNVFAQPIGTNSQYWYLDFDFSGMTSKSSVFIPWPQMNRCTANSKVIFDRPQRSVTAFNSGPAYRWDAFSYWDSFNQVITSWPLAQPYALSPSALDAICFWNNLRGLDALTNLDGIIRTFYDSNNDHGYPFEYSQDKHLVSDPFSQAQLTHAFTLPTGTSGTRSIALVNSFSEVPPLCGIPNPKRDPDTWVAAPSLGWSNVVYSWCQGRRYVAEPSSGSTELTQVRDHSGNVVPSQEESSPTGWRFWSYKLATTDNTEQNYTLSRGNVSYATFRPWRGIFWTGLDSLIHPGLHVAKNLPTSMYCASYSTTNVLHLWRFDYKGINDNQIIYTADSGTILGLSQVIWYPRNAIACVYESNNALYYTESEAEGLTGTWSTPVLVASGVKNPAFAFDPIACYGYCAGFTGTAWQIYELPNGTTTWNLVGTIVTTTSDSAAGLHWSPDGSGALTFVYNDGSANQHLISTDRGVTWY